jgi:hypothetical protein
LTSQKARPVKAIRRTVAGAKVIFKSYKTKMNKRTLRVEKITLIKKTKINKPKKLLLCNGKQR